MRCLFRHAFDAIAPFDAMFIRQFFFAAAADIAATLFCFAYFRHALMPR